MVDTGCPRVGYRHIAFHSRGCVEPQRSGREERAARVLVWRHAFVQRGYKLMVVSGEYEAEEGVYATCDDVVAQNSADVIITDT
jgi:hypothetical protein